MQQMAHMVASAVVQETVTRVTSYLFSKHDNNENEAASRGHDIEERLETAHTELEFVLERSARIPITDVSLLRRRKLLKRAFKDCGDLLHRCSKQQRTVDVIEIEQPATRFSFHKRISQLTQSFMSSYFTGFCKDSISYSDVRRYEWLAERANRFLRDVESGCSARPYMFSNPLVRQLLEGKTLEYKMVEGSILRRLHIWPMCMEGRGVEVALEFHYEDRRKPTRSFAFGLMLRLSESTDIVGTAIRCLQSFTSSMKLVAEAVIRELGQLPMQDISHSCGPAPRFSIQGLRSYDTQFWRPDPLCCKPNGFAGHNIPSELSCKFPEPVILVHVECYYSTSEGSSMLGVGERAVRNIADERPALKLGVGLAPHFYHESMQGRFAVEISNGKVECISDSLEQMDEMVRSKAMNRYICYPGLKDYRLCWHPGHGVVYFIARKPGPRTASMTNSMVRCGVKRRQSERETGSDGGAGSPLYAYNWRCYLGSMNQNSIN